MSRLSNRSDDENALQPLHTVADAAAILRCCTKKVYGLLKTGTIKVVRIGRALRITDESLRAFIEASAMR